MDQRTSFKKAQQETPEATPVSDAIPLGSIRSENPEVANILSQESQALEDRGGLFVSNLTTDGYNQTQNRKILRVATDYRDPQRDILFYVRLPESKTKGAVFTVNIVSRENKGQSLGRVSVPREGGIARGKKTIQTAQEAVIKMIAGGSATQFTQGTPNARDNAEENARSARATASGNTEADSTNTERVPRPETPTPDSGRQRTPNGSEDISSGEHIYQGATFTEENGQLTITGDAIPESFWDYWHSGGRGRNSRHKKAMRDAGWKYSFRGSNPRVYSFSISRTNFDRWIAENPDDGSPPVEETPSAPSVPQTKEQKSIDYLEQLRGYVRERVAAGATPEAAIIGVRNDLSERVYNEADAYYASDLLENHPDYPQESIGEGRPRPYEWIEDRLREGLPEETQREITERAAAVPSEDEIKNTVLSKLTSGDYTQADGYHYYMDIEGAGQVDVYLSTVGKSTYDIGGLSEMTYETDITIQSKEHPSKFKWITIKMPQTLVDKYDSQFEDEFLGELRDRQNWERLGRKNAFKHTKNGAFVNILKDTYGYKATFSEMPRIGVTFVNVDGSTLEERLQNALDKLKPSMFRFDDRKKIADTFALDKLDQEATDESTTAEKDQPGDSEAQPESQAPPETEPDASDVDTPPDGR